MTKQTIEQAVEEFGNQFDELNMRPPKHSMPRLERELLKDFMRKALTADHLALLTELRASGLLENKPMNVFSFVLQGEELEHYMRYKGHNLAVEAIKAHLDELIKATSI